VMDRGRIVQVATPPEIYEQPQTRWVAQFVGDINLIEGGVVEMSDGMAVIADGAGRLYHVAIGTAGGTGGVAAAGTASGARVAIAVRPEKLRICAAPAPDAAGDDNAVRGRVFDIGYLGGVSIYKVRLDDGTVMKAAVANVARLLDPPIGPDQEVLLSFAPGAAVVLTD
jgi:putrescine transport system ATP-binding protein